MKTSEMIRIFEDNNTPFGTEFRYSLEHSSSFRAIKGEWGGDGYIIRFYRDDKRVNEMDAHITSLSDWELVGEKRVEMTVKEIEERLGYKVSIID